MFTSLFLVFYVKKKKSAKITNEKLLIINLNKTIFYIINYYYINII